MTKLALEGRRGARGLRGRFNWTLKKYHRSCSRKEGGHCFPHHGTRTALERDHSLPAGYPIRCLTTKPEGGVVSLKGPPLGAI